jgi:hypothetical protein
MSGKSGKTQSEAHLCLSAGLPLIWSNVIVGFDDNVGLNGGDDGEEAVYA